MRKLCNKAVFIVLVYCFSLQIYQGYTQLVDTGALYDSTLSGGRVGVFQFGEFPVIWSYLKVSCLEHLNQGLYLDGVDDFVELDNITALQMEDRYISFVKENFLFTVVVSMTGAFSFYSE